MRTPRSPGALPVIHDRTGDLDASIGLVASGVVRRVLLAGQPLPIAAVADRRREALRSGVVVEVVQSGTRQVAILVRAAPRPVA